MNIKSQALRCFPLDFRGKQELFRPVLGTETERRPNQAVLQKIILAAAHPENPCLSVFDGKQAAAGFLTPFFTAKSLYGLLERYACFFT